VEPSFKFSTVWVVILRSFVLRGAVRGTDSGRFTVDGGVVDAKKTKVGNPFPL
jgi:hypothetical protein